MSDSTITFLVLGGVVALFIATNLAVDVVAIAAALALWATGVLTIDQSVAGFGEPTVIFIAALFVVSEGLDATGVTAWAGGRLSAAAAGSQNRLIIYTIVLVAVLTAAISVNGAVAALLPVIVVCALRMNAAPSALLIPLVFGAHAGSLLTLTGSPVSVIVSDAASDNDLGRFGYFSFALVGVPLVVGTTLIVVLAGKHLIPARTPRTMAADFSRHARILVEQYLMTDRVTQLRLDASSPLVGSSPTELPAAASGTSLIGVRRNGDGRLLKDGTLAEGDTLVMRGDPVALDNFAHLYGLTNWSDPHAPEHHESLFTEHAGVAEVIVPPRSELIGENVFAGMVTDSGNMVVLALQRSGIDIDTETTLQAGDTLLLQGTWDALSDNLGSPDLRVVDDPELVRRQVPRLGRRGSFAVLVLVAMIGVLASGVVPPVAAGLGGAGLMVLARLVSIEQAYRAVNWTTVVLVGAMIAVSTAMQESGAAEKLANGLVDIVGESSPYLLTFGLCLLTAVLGQLISNTATALIVIPIALSAAADTGVSGKPLLMAVNVVAAAAFLTPVATPVNLMVMEPAGYRFGDYWKIGLPLMVLFIAVATFLVPVYWPY